MGALGGLCADTHSDGIGLDHWGLQGENAVNFLSRKDRKISAIELGSDCSAIWLDQIVLEKSFDEVFFNTISLILKIQAFLVKAIKAFFVIFITQLYYTYKSYVYLS